MGDWFTPPVDYDEMAERIGLNDRYEEYAIHDYELPFEIDEYTPIEEVNRLCEMVEELDYPLNEVIDDLLCHFAAWRNSTTTRTTLSNTLATTWWTLPTT